MREEVTVVDGQLSLKTRVIPDGTRRRGSFVCRFNSTNIPYTVEIVFDSFPWRSFRCLCFGALRIVNCRGAVGCSSSASDW